MNVYGFGGRRIAPTLNNAKCMHLVLFVLCCLVPSTVSAFHIGCDNDFSLNAGHVLWGRLVLDGTFQYVYKNNKNYEGTHKRKISTDRLEAYGIGFKLFGDSFFSLISLVVFQFEKSENRYRLQGDDSYTIDDYYYSYNYMIRVQPEFELVSNLILFIRSDVINFEFARQRLPKRISSNRIRMYDLDAINLGLKLSF